MGSECILRVKRAFEKDGEIWKEDLGEGKKVEKVLNGFRGWKNEFFSIWKFLKSSLKKIQIKKLKKSKKFKKKSEIF